MLYSTMFLMQAGSSSRLLSYPISFPPRAFVRNQFFKLANIGIPEVIFRYLRSIVTTGQAAKMVSAENLRWRIKIGK